MSLAGPFLFETGDVVTKEVTKVLTTDGRPSMLLDMETISLSDLRPQLSKTVKKVEEGSPVAVTRVNLPVTVLLSWTAYQELVNGQRLARNG